MDEAELFERALAEDGAAQAALAARIVADPALRARWIAHGRLAVLVRGRRPRSDLAARVLALVRARRPSRRLRLVRRVRARYRPLLPLAAAAIVLLALGLWWRGARSVPPVPSTPVVTAADVPAPPRIELGGARATVADDVLEVEAGVPELVWADGSVAAVAPGSRLRLEAEPDLAAGRVRLTVAPRAAGAAAFRVRAGPLAATVHGTRFAIERTGDAAAVLVEEGVVEIAVGGATRRLAAGDGARWDGRVLRGERALWTWTPVQPLRYGAWDPATALLTSTLFREEGGAEPCIALRGLSIPSDGALELQARVRCDAPTRLTFQAHLAGGWNLAQTLAAPAGWSTLRWRFADLRPYQARPAPAADARFDDLLVISDGRVPFAFAEWRVVQPLP